MKLKTMSMLRRCRTGLPLIALLIVTVFSVSGCGDKLIRGVSPVVRINELGHDGKNISLQLSLRNRNGVELNVQHINLSMKVEGADLFAFNGAAKINIVANGTETWSVELAESESSQDKLNSLETGEVKSLPYSFSGTVTALDAGNLKFEYDGHLYPVPGRPGQFR